MPRKPNFTAAGYNTAFAKNLRTLIDETGISQQVLADSLPMKRTRQAISQYASGITTPDYETLIEIARYFNVSVDWLIGYSSVRSSSPELRAICEYTGLSEDALRCLNRLRPDKIVNVCGMPMQIYKDLPLHDFLNYALSEDPQDYFTIASMSGIESAIHCRMRDKEIDDRADPFDESEIDKLRKEAYKRGYYMLRPGSASSHYMYQAVDEFKELVWNYIEKRADQRYIEKKDFYSSLCCESEKEE